MPQLTDLGSLKIEATDSFDDVNSLLYRLGLTDGLPIVPPTAQRVDIRVAKHPDDIMLVVVGGAGIKSAYVPTWGGTTRAVTRGIDLP
jgi:hypothetical protein